MTLARTKLFGCLLALLCFAWSATAAVVVLEWDANTETNVVGYRVYAGGSSRVYESVFDVGNVTVRTNDFPIGQHFVAVTAYDTDGLESEFSDEVALEIVAPPALRFESNTLTWAGAGSWQVRWSNDTVTNRQIFFTNRIALGLFPAGCELSVRRYELGPTNVLSDFSAPLHYNPPQIAGTVRVRVVLQKTGNINEPFVDFSEASFFDAVTDQSFYRARLEIMRSGPRLR